MNKSKSSVLLFALAVIVASAPQVLAVPIPTPDGGTSAGLLALSLVGLGIARKIASRKH